MEDDRIAIDDVYAALTAPGVSWVDTRADGPSHFVTVDNVLAWNAFLADSIAAWRAHGALPVVLSACIRSLGQASVL